MNQFNRKPVTVLANAVQTGPENRSPTLSPELRQKLSAENRCFKCRIKGHYARNCRTNPFSNTNNPFNNYPRNNGNAREIRATYTSNSNTSAVTFLLSSFPFLTPISPRTLFYSYSSSDFICKPFYSYSPDALDHLRSPQSAVRSLSAVILTNHRHSRLSLVTYQ